MANSLLDFVISLVRDPEAAARYAANPAQSIADAHLTDVSSVDVNNLIPMVSDSLSMANPGGAVLGVPAADHGNVWASGAAAAALDAFSPQTPPAALHQHAPVDGVINQPHAFGAPATPTDPRPLVSEPHHPSVLLTGAEAPDAAVDHSVFPTDHPAGWDHSAAHPHTGDPDHHGFGLHG